MSLAVRVHSSGADKHITREIRSLQFSSSVPGGFAAATLTLNRPISINDPALAQFATLTIYDGRNAQTLWEGRIGDLGRGVSQDGQVWTVVAEGPAAHARDRSLALIYIDHRLDPWIRASAFRSLDTGTEQDTSDNPALRFHLPRGVIVNAGTSVGGLVYTGLADTAQKMAICDYTNDEGVTDADWQLELIARVGTASGGSIVRAEGYNTSGHGSSAKKITTDWSSSENAPFIRVRRVTTNQTVGNDDTWALVSDLYVGGTRYTAAGTEITTAATYLSTVSASDIVNDLLGRVLNKYDGANASVAATSFRLDQLAYSDGTATPEKILADLMVIEPGYYWAAWESTGSGYRFEWVAWPTTVRYEADTSDGFDSPGSSVDLYDRVRVRWRYPNGRIGQTVRTQTVQALTDAGLSREALVDLGDELGSLANAQQAGDGFLAAHSTPPNAGTLTVKRPIRDLIAGRTVMPYEIRPGTLIRVRDVLPRVDALNATDRDAVTVFRVVQVDYDLNSGTATLSLDSKPKHLSALVAQARKDFEQARRR